MKFSKPYIIEIVRNLEKGGRTKRVLQTAEMLRARGFSVKVATFFKPPEWVRKSWPGSENWVFLNKSEGLDFLLIWRIYRLLKQEKVDALHAHCEDSYFYGGLAAKLAGIPAVGTYHRPHSNCYVRTWKNAIWNSFLRHKVAVSSDRLRLMVDGLNIPEPEISVIHAGANLKTIKPLWNKPEIEIIRQKLKIPANSKVILSIGHLGSIKGHDVTLKGLPSIIKNFPQTLFYIAGDGSPDEWSRVRNLIDSLGVQDHVSLLGQQGNIEEWLVACDVVVHSSFAEAFSLIFTEAGAAGRPTIGTRVGGIEDIMLHEETGFLVEPGDSKAIVEYVMRIFEDKNLTEKMGRAARRRVEEHFNLDILGDRYSQLFDKIISHKA